MSYDPGEKLCLKLQVMLREVHVSLILGPRLKEQQLPVTACCSNDIGQGHKIGC